MIETAIEVKLTAEPLTKEIIPDLIGAAGPCITLILPSYRPGEPGQSAAAVLKTDLHEAARKLAADKIAEPLISELLEPLRQLSHEEGSLAGSGSARVIFRSHGIFRQFELPIPPAPARACTVGDCFWIRPILASLALPSHVYILELTKKAVTLLACGITGVVTPLELPAKLPKTLDAFLGFDQPDHDLINRSTAGPSTGSMPGVQFGTGSGRETQHAHLADFYRAVDRGVNELLHSSNAPLVLAGVDEDVTIYRSVNTYNHLLSRSTHGSPGAVVRHAQRLRQAYNIALFEVQERAALKMAALNEDLAPARFSADFESILRAAAEGRVSDLFLDENGQRRGNFGGAVFGGRADWHEEDLLNVAAVETLRHGGAVHSLPSHLMTGAVAAAALRY